MKPYTIRIYVPDGNPNSLKIIDKINWTGVGLEISRDTWEVHKNRKELKQAGIYILIGRDEQTDLPILYIGQGDEVKNRIESHYNNKKFWNKVLVFVSNNKTLNRAHITWLEWALIKRAIEIDRCKLDNNTTPKEPILIEYEKAATREFLNDILSVFPLVDIKVFDKAKKIEVRETEKTENIIKDTVIVPAQEESFKDLFIGQNCWHSIRISSERLNEIKYIAAYQTSPISAITHYAEVESIEDYGDEGKYQLNFKASAKEITPIELGKAKSGTLRGPRYTDLETLLKSKTVKDIFVK